jgi:hypothetical protein
MRPVILADLLAAAQALLLEVQNHRTLEAQRLLDRAHAADLFRKRTGRRHRDWGDGTLAAACSRMCTQSFRLSDPAAAAAMAAVLLALAQRRQEGLVRRGGSPISD